GKAKVLYEGPEPGTLIQHFKDDATAFNAQKRGTIASKGVVNNAISEVLFKELESRGVKTHLVRRLNDREMLVRKLSIFPVELVVRNVVAGSLAKRLGMEEGGDLPAPIVELYYKDDALGDPMINDDHVVAFGWAKPDELRHVKRVALEVDEILRKFLLNRGILLVDFKLEFGRSPSGEILLGDEICPDTCRLWDSKTREKLDKDRFRRDLGGVEEAYQEVYRRVVP
ncbi:MAG: phosphoribosylaminoimidazolesuccinocarboxamide synthase, partial [Alphaproteobacteria bacterium]